MNTGGISDDKVQIPTEINYVFICKCKFTKAAVYNAIKLIICQAIKANHKGYNKIVSMLT